MPTVLRVGAYRFFFYSSDGREPPHVHVEAADNTAKFWLSPLQVTRSQGFSDRELRKIEKIIGKHLDGLLEAWNGYFGT
jgi:hypothetical protein